LLWIASYLPLPVAGAAILHKFGLLYGEAATRRFIAVAWALQLLLGFVGLCVAGREVISIIKQQGWRRMPATLWLVLRGRPLPDN
jgi:hypothetical protein